MSVSLLALARLLLKDEAQLRERIVHPMLVWRLPTAPAEFSEFVIQRTTEVKRLPRTKTSPGDDVEVTVSNAAARSPAEVRGMSEAFEVNKLAEGRDRFSFVTIGRAVTNDIPIDHDSVSRLHAFIDRDPQTAGWRVGDSGSRNGTSVDGEKLEPNTWKPLTDGCTLRVGKAELRFLMPGTFVETLRKLTK